jgi:hypothetical protein
VSKYKVPNGTRVALWRAHGKRCAYCGEPLSYPDLDIDHILPESLPDNPTEWNRVKAELGLDADFGLNSLLNLVPAHRRCNRTKSDDVFHSARARFFLEVAIGKEALVKSYLSSLALQNQKEQVLAAVANAFETGVITLGELADVNSETNAFPLSHGLEFADGSRTGSIRQEDIENLLDKAVLVGGSAEIDGVQFVNDSGTSMKVRTCREYRAARAAGLYTLTNFDMKMEAFLATANATIEAVSRARTAAISYIRTPHAGVCDLHLLPKAALPVIAPDMDTELKGIAETSLKELALKGAVKIRDVSSTRLNFEWQFAGAVLTELLRADLDGDDIEELLVQQVTYAVGGTLSFGHVSIFRRTSPDGMFEITVPEF